MKVSDIQSFVNAQNDEKTEKTKMLELKPEDPSFKIRSTYILGGKKSSVLKV